MRRIGLLCLFVLALALAPLTVQAQPATACPAALSADDCALIEAAIRNALTTTNGGLSFTAALAADNLPALPDDLQGNASGQVLIDFGKLPDLKGLALDIRSNATINANAQSMTFNTEIRVLDGIFYFKDSVGTGGQWAKAPLPDTLPSISMKDIETGLSNPQVAGLITELLNVPGLVTRGGNTLVSPDGSERLIQIGLDIGAAADMPEFRAWFIKFNKALDEGLNFGVTIPEETYQREAEETATLLKDLFAGGKVTLLLKFNTQKQQWVGFTLDLKMAIEVSFNLQVGFVSINQGVSVEAPADAQ
jgi:hypothetical protein